MKDTQQTEGELCIVCGAGTRGGFEVWESSKHEGYAMIAIDSTPDRNFNVCDLCNDVVHFRCSKHPESGYCDPCFKKIYPIEAEYKKSVR